MAPPVKEEEPIMDMEVETTEAAAAAELSEEAAASAAAVAVAAAEASGGGGRDEGPVNNDVEPMKVEEGEETKTEEVEEAAAATDAAETPTPAVAGDTTAQAKADDEPNDNEEEEEEESAKKRKSIKAPKALIHKKDFENGLLFLKDKRELAEILPLPDCFFLAEKYWVFTHEQLQSFLDSLAAAGEGDGAAALKQDVLAKLQEEVPKQEEEENKTNGDATKSEEEDVEEGKDKTTSVAPLGGLTKDEAEKRLVDWKEALAEGKDTPATAVEEKFPLTGPIRFLMAPGIRNFLASVPTKTLLDYFGLKKTETGAVCEMLAYWREKNDLPRVSFLAAARYLIGLGARFEAAVFSEKPVDETTRMWLSDPIIVLTGAAREFLVKDQEIMTADEFVATRTKDLSTALVEWREKKGLEPLKGSGKVAMISSWKAAAREAIDINGGFGEPLPEGELKDMAQLLISESSTPSKITADSAATKTPKPSASKAEYIPSSLASSLKKARKRGISGSKQADYDLHSKYFLEQVLGEKATEALGAASIHTAAQLFEADTTSESVLAGKVVEAELITDAAEAAKIAADWGKELKERLEEIRSSDTLSESNKRARFEHTSTPSTPNNPHGMQKYEGVSDPYELLSAITKKFLITIGIETAEEFLTTRTTDMAQKFVDFRVEEGLAPLKGLGSIASVSGWKANCRKYAREMGLDDIAALEPPGHVSGPQKAIAKESAPKMPAKKSVDDEQEKNGSERRTLVVERSGSSTQFRFDLSLRKSDVNPGRDTYLTYKGAAPCVPVDGDATRVSSTLRVRESGDPEAIHTVDILGNAPLNQDVGRSVDTRMPFHISQAECGLIELHKCGVKPANQQDLDLSLLKEEVINFVLAKDKRTGRETQRPMECNVIVRRKELDKCEYLLHVATPLEAGQTMALRFASPSHVLKSCGYKDSSNQQRHLVLESLHLLSKADLQSLLLFLAEEVVEVIDFESVMQEASSHEAADDSQMRKLSAQLCAACEARLRVYWLSRRIVNIIDHEVLLPDESRVSDKLYFGRKKLATDPNAKFLPKEALFSIKKAAQKELKAGFLSLVEFDDVCGSLQRKKWCGLGRDLFDGMIDDILGHCVASATSTDIKDTLLRRLDSLIGVSFSGDIAPRFVFGVSPLKSEPEDKADRDVVIVVDKGDMMNDTTGEGMENARAVSQSVLVRGTVVVHANWYKKYLGAIATRVIGSFGLMLHSSDFSTEEVFEHLATSLGGEDTAYQSIPNMDLVGPLTLPVPPNQPFEPQSYQFFFGIVWPKLREYGWRLVVNTFPSDVTFYYVAVPGKKVKLAKFAKRERDRKRADMIRQVNQLGLGFLPKLAKRLFVAASRVDENAGEATQRVSGPAATSVEEILAKFLAQLVEGLPENDEDGKAKAKRITRHVKDCFKDFAPLMRSIFRGDDDDDDAMEVDSKRTCVDYGGDVFMRFLLTIPSVLRHSELPLQEMNDVLQIVQELTAFMTTHYQTLFPEQLKPPIEDYAVKEKLPLPSTVAKLCRISKSSTEESSPDDSTLSEAIWEEDEKDLTDFVVTVMQQVVPCRASESDANRKNRRIHLGHPGLANRHYNGPNGEGRFFFSSVESLATLPNVLENHLLKCAQVPDDIRKLIISTREKHVSQLKELPNGCQNAFFKRLWERLRSMKIAGEGPEPVLAQDVAGMPSPGPRANGGLGGEDSDPMPSGAHREEFANHIAVLDHLRTTAPWKGSRDIEQVLGQYYSCLDYGGRIYNTKSMPKHFSTGWLLGKIAPKQRRKRKYALPG